MRTGNSIKRCLSIGKRCNVSFPRDNFYFARISEGYKDYFLLFPYYYKWESGLVSLMVREFLRDVNHRRLK